MLKGTFWFISTIQGKQVWGQRQIAGRKIPLIPKHPSIPFPEFQSLPTKGATAEDHISALQSDRSSIEDGVGGERQGLLSSECPKSLGNSTSLVISRERRIYTKIKSTQHIFWGLFLISLCSLVSGKVCVSRACLLA